MAEAKRKKPVAKAKAKPTAKAKAKPAAKAKPKKPKPTKPAGPTPFAGQRWAFFGELAIWPRYHGASPETVAKRRGATIVDDIAKADVVVLGDLRSTGRADAKKRAERARDAGTLRLLDEAEYRELVRIDLAGKRFAFIGGFDCSPTGDASMLATMVERAGGVVQPAIDATLDYLVIGNRRGPSKIALLNSARRLVEAGAPLGELDESAFMELVRIDTPASASASGAAGDGAASGELDFPGFMTQLYGHVDDKRLGRALDMLRKDRFQLYSRVDEERVYGVVHSQKSTGIYTSWLTSKGRYGCSQTTLEDCMGLQGAVCKHLLVLVVGLARTKQLPMDHALAWMREAHRHSPSVDTTLCAETFIQYKGATAGEVDWRPTETLPEDFYAL